MYFRPNFLSKDGIKSKILGMGGGVPHVGVHLSRAPAGGGAAGQGFLGGCRDITNKLLGGDSHCIDGVFH